MLKSGGVRAFSPIRSAEPYLIEVGSNTTVSTNVSFVTHDNSAIKVFENATDLVGSIKIGENCFIGLGSILLPGVNIADNCIVGAGSVITRSFYEPGKIIAGNPAREIGDVSAYRKKYEELSFNFRGIDAHKKKMMLLENEGK